MVLLTTAAASALLTAALFPAPSSATPTIHSSLLGATNNEVQGVVSRFWGYYKPPCSHCFSGRECSTGKCWAGRCVVDQTQYYSCFGAPFPRAPQPAPFQFAPRGGGGSDSDSSGRGGFRGGGSSSSSGGGRFGGGGSSDSDSSGHRGFRGGGSSSSSGGRHFGGGGSSDSDSSGGRRGGSGSDSSGGGFRRRPQFPTQQFGHPTFGLRGVHRASVGFTERSGFPNNDSDSDSDDGGAHGNNDGGSNGNEVHPYYW